MLMMSSDASFVAFLFFEYSITLDRELCYLRDHKRTWAKMIFVLNRYMSLVKAFATLLSAVLPVSTFVSTPSPFKRAVFANRIQRYLLETYFRHPLTLLLS